MFITLTRKYCPSAHPAAVSEPRDSAAMVLTKELITDGESGAEQSHSFDGRELSASDNDKNSTECYQLLIDNNSMSIPATQPTCD